MVTTIFQTIRDRLAGFLGVTHRGTRDTYGQFGYPQILTPEVLWATYLRNGMASRIVRTFPKATWREPPLIWDMQGNSPEKGPNFSEFSASIDKLFNQFKIWSYLERADRVSGVGRYGLLVMGFQDGQTMDKPLAPGKHPLLYLSVYGELNIDVNQWDTNPASPRYGMPVLYTCRTGSLTGLVASGEPQQKRSFTAHWTRVIHLAEMLDEDEVFGTPRLVPVYNWLLDLEKTAGASAETFWLNARAGLVLSAKQDANYSEEDKANMRQQAEEYESQLRRILAVQGIEAQPLTAEVADPEPNIDKLLDLIAGTCEIPKRILIGSERGELSSSQDENNFAARVNERCVNYAGPSILKPFIQRMIDTQNVSRPQEEWGIDWPSAGQTPEQQANVGRTRSETLRNYVTAPGAEIVVPPNEFRREMLGLPAEPDVEDLPEEEENLDDTDLVDVSPGDDDGTDAGDGGTDPGDDEEGNRSVTPPDQRIENVDPEEEGEDPEAAERLRRMTAGLSVWRFKGEQLEKMQRLALRANVRFKPKPLYVCRRLLNVDDIHEWMRKQAFSTMVPHDELHATIVYSKQPIDWMRIPEAWAGNDDGELIIKPGGPRIVDCLGDKGAVVLFFNSSEMSWRHETIRALGASWEHDGYQPHLTLTYDRDDLDLEEVEPYTGKLVFGPEEFKEIQKEYVPDLREMAL